MSIIMDTLRCVNVSTTMSIITVLSGYQATLSEPTEVRHREGEKYELRAVGQQDQAFEGEQ